MATPTYDLIDSVTLSSSATSVTFSSITQDYRDLILVCEASSNNSPAGFYGRYNGDTANNYHTVFLPMVMALALLLTLGLQGNLSMILGIMLPLGAML
jgi:hypothetical protein